MLVICDTIPLSSMTCDAGRDRHFTSFSFKDEEGQPQTMAWSLPGDSVHLLPRNNGLSILKLCKVHTAIEATLTRKGSDHRPCGGVCWGGGAAVCYPLGRAGHSVPVLAEQCEAELPVVAVQGRQGSRAGGGEAHQFRWPACCVHLLRPASDELTQVSHSSHIAAECPLGVIMLDLWARRNGQRRQRRQMQ